MILRTKITNLQETSDAFTWLNRNVGLVAPGQTVVLEGSPDRYLSNASNYALFEKARLAGYIKVVLETDLSVHRLKQDETMKENVMQKEAQVATNAPEVEATAELPTNETFTKEPEAGEIRDLMAPSRGHTIPVVPENELFQ